MPKPANYIENKFLLHSTVILRFKKSISWHHFETKLSIERLFIVYSNTLIYGPYSGLIIVIFGPILMDFFWLLSQFESSCSEIKT